MLVEPADAFAVEALFLDLEIGPEQQRSRKLLDRKADGFGGGIEAPVADRDLALAAAARKQLADALKSNATVPNDSAVAHTGFLRSLRTFWRLSGAAHANRRLPGEA